MKPTLEEVEVRYAVDLLARELDADKRTIREALENEAHYYLNEGEKATGGPRIDDLE
jgi:hypothetical protein